MKHKTLLFSFLFLTIGNFSPGALASQEPPAAIGETRSILLVTEPVFNADSASHTLLGHSLLQEQRLSSGGRSFWLFPAIGAGLGAATSMVVILSDDGDNMGGIPFVVFSGGVGALMGGIVGLGVEVFVRAAEG